MIDPSALARLKRDYEAGEPMHRLAALYDLGETQIAQRAKAGNWTRPAPSAPDVAPSIAVDRAPPPKASKALTPHAQAHRKDGVPESVKREARSRFAAGCTIPCLSNRHHVTLATLRKWRDDERWTVGALPAATAEQILNLPPEQLAERIGELLQAERELALTQAKLLEVRDDYLADDAARMRERATYEATIAELRAQPRTVIATRIETIMM